MKPRIKEERVDFRGGLNTKVAADMLNVNEFVQLANARISSKVGGFRPRLGTRRMHTTALGAAIDGIYQWIPEGGAKQLVAVADGDVSYKATAYGEFATSDETLGQALTQFATMRENASGAPLRLYLADGTGLFRWDGATLAALSGSASIPDNVDLVRSMHARLFLRSTDYMNSLFWTDLGDPEAANGTGKDGGGSAIINVLGGEFITALEVVAGVLMIPTEDSLAAFQGYSDDDIQIAQDSEGRSSTEGCSGPNAIVAADKVGFMLGGGGVFLLTPDGKPELVSRNVEDELLALDRTQLSSVALGWHKARRELWVALGGTVYVFSPDLRAWSGPFEYDFDITCFTNYEDGNGDPTLIAGCSDGFVRNMDTGLLDDVLADGTGGDEYTVTVEPAPFLFPSAGAEVTKTIHRFAIKAQVAADEEISVKHAWDDGALTTETLTGLTSSRILSYRVDATANQGERLRVVLESVPTSEWLITGLTVFAFDMSREE